MKNALGIFLILFSCTVFSQSDARTIKGVVTDMGRPLANVNVMVTGADTGTNTDAHGNYTIQAIPGDVLVFSYVGMQTVEIIVEDITSTLNIELFPEVQELDEVIVEKKKKKTQTELWLEYDTNKNLIRTTYGIMDKNRSGYSMTVIDGADINNGAINFMDAIQGMFSGQVVQSTNGPRIYLRRSKYSAIYDLDGVVMEDAPTYISVSSIKRIAIIPGSAAFAKYGSKAVGGVIVINTERGTIFKESGTDKPYDRALLRDNIFDETSIKGNFVAEAPAFLKELYNSKSKTGALEVFENKKGLYGGSPYYLLGIGTYFLNKWKDRAKAEELFALIQNSFPDNAPALKALAYKYQENGDWEAARDIYIKVFKLRPKYSESYRDLANAYAESGDISKGVGLYARYMASQKMDNRSGQLVGIDSIIKVEAGNLLYTSSDNLANKDKLQQNLGFWPIRILVEWNNSESEFDLQFVHPSKHYFIWNHTLEESPDRIKGEKLRGYGSEQFLIDNSAMGEWLINLKYYGNRSYDPTYLKITTYRDYGTSSQKKEIKVFELTEKNINQTLLTLYTPGSRASSESSPFGG